MKVHTCSSCNYQTERMYNLKVHQKDKHKQVEENKNKAMEIRKAHVSLERGTETQTGVEMDVDEEGSKKTPNICEILTDILAFDYLNDMWNMYGDASPQLIKHICSIFDTKCNRRSYMKMHQKNNML